MKFATGDTKERPEFIKITKFSNISFDRLAVLT